MKRRDKSAWILLLAILVAGVAAAQEPPEANPPEQGGEETAAETAATEPAPPAGPAAVEPVEPAAEAPEEGPPEAEPLPPEEALAVDQLFEGLKSGRFWLTLLVALVFGGVGGVVYELLILQGNIERYHRTEETEAGEPFPYAIAKNLIDLGIWARVIIGAMAAVAALWLLSPETPLGLVAGATIAGSAGTSVFRSLQDRLLATLAQKDAEDVRHRAALQSVKVDRAMELMNMKAPRAASEIPVVPAGSAEALQEAKRLLSEAQGIGQSLQRGG